jgi:hypothetical protein
VPDADFFGKPRFCSQCGRPVIVEGATFCKECGASLEAGGTFGREIRSRRTISFLLSVVPGLGHVYQGHLLRGIIWFFGVAMAYGAGPIGYLIHLICAVNAASYGSTGEPSWRRRRRRRSGRLSARF